MTQQQCYLTLLILAATFCSTTVNAQAGVLNGDFEGYTNAVHGMAISAATPSSWKETGVGGHTFLVTQSSEVDGFVAYGGSPGEIDVDPIIPYAAQITGSDNGIYNSFSSIAGEEYFVDFHFGVVRPGASADIGVYFYDGPGIAGPLLHSFRGVLDPVNYGNGLSTGTFVSGGATALSGTTTVLFVLHSSPATGYDTMYLDGVIILGNVVPEPSAVWVLGLGACFALIRRHKHSKVANQY